MHTPGGKQEMSIVSESGLYSLTLGSKKPEAKPFKRWVTHDVLPALRKTGTYSISGYAPKAASLGEVASFLKVMRSIMKENGQLPEKIAEMAETMCKQFNIKIPENFVRRNPFEQTSLFNITNNIFLPQPRDENMAAKEKLKNGGT
jgi:prophage antirepressor-like protein